METFRDASLGQLLRFLTGKRCLRYPEESDPSIWAQYYLETNQDGQTGSDARNEQDQDPGSPESSGTEMQLDAGVSEKEKSYIVVGWRGPNDGDNPQNWSNGKKIFVSILIWLLTFSIYIGSSIYTAGILGVSAQFGVSTVAATLGLTLFVIGYGLGPMVWSPLSEISAIGRTPVYVGTLVVFVFFEFAVIYAKNFGMLLAFRFLTGFFGSPALAMGGASMTDIWNPRTVDYMFAIWGAFAVAAPVLGPLVGGFAANAKGWTWTIWELLWVSGFTLVILFIFLPETSTPNILYRRAHRVRKITGNSKYRAEAEIELMELKPKQILIEAVIRPFEFCFFEPVILIMNIYTSLIYGILYMWFEAYPIVFGTIHGFNLGEIGLAFLGILVGVFITIPSYCFWKYYYQSKHLNENLDMAPERQLPPACIGSIILPASIFWFGWTGNFSSVHWISPIIASAFFAAGGMLIFNAVFTYQGHAYPKYAASALAANDFMRSSFAAGFPLFAGAMFKNLGVGWACTLLGCLTVVFVPYPFLLYWFGRKIRLSSRYARHDI